MYTNIIYTNIITNAENKLTNIAPQFGTFFSFYEMNIFHEVGNVMLAVLRHDFVYFMFQESFTDDEIEVTTV